MSKKHIANKSLDQRVTVRLSTEEKQNVENLFVDLPNVSAKLRYVVLEYFKFVKKYPYLSSNQETLNPEDAGFLPLLCVKPIYWEGKFLGFQCIIRKPPIDLPRISLKDSEGHRITLKITTPDLCVSCVELCRKKKIGLDLFSHITLESIREHKKAYKVDRVRTRIADTKGRAGRKVNRDEAFKMFALDRPKKYVKRQLRIAERTYWRIRGEYEALSPAEKEKIVASVSNYS